MRPKTDDFSKEQLEELYKAACLLADRYREERDGARAERAALQTKLDANQENVGDAIEKSLRDAGSGSAPGVSTARLVADMRAAQLERIKKRAKKL